MRRAAFSALSAAAVLGLSACGSGSETDTATGTGAEGPAPLEVVVGAYPYEFVAERVGGDAVEVVNLTPPGAEPHDVELTAQQVGGLTEADVVLLSTGFQPALDEAVAQQAPDAVLDVLEVVETRTALPHGHEGESAEEHAEHAGEEHSDEEAHAEGEEHAGEEHAEEGVDPHVWLDPTKLGEVAGALADRLAEERPEEADAFRQRAQELQTELTALDDELATGLAGCERTEFVVSHDAFGYLADRYELTQLPISGLSPEEEPSPGRLAEVADLARERGVTTVFFEEQVSPALSEQLAREVGAQTDVLSPLEIAPESGDYLAAMRDNLASLRSALGCA